MNCVIGKKEGSLDNTPADAIDKMNKMFDGHEGLGLYFCVCLVWCVFCLCVCGGVFLFCIFFYVNSAGRC
jgi:hypothetical protein